jgi:GT2 family glycosyltransferase
MNSALIVVLNWNGIDDTLKCLDSLLAQDYKDFHILVVDNGSIDNSKDLLEKYQKSHNDIIDVIYNPINFGFAGGVNTGIEWALNEEYEYVALFNNDAIADKKWLSSLINAVKPDDIGICTGLLLHEDGKTIDSTGDWFSKWGLAFPRARGKKTSTAPEKGFVFGASGGASLYKTSLLKEIGLFDEDFFAYYEDVDISFRAQLAGHKVAYTPNAVAYHKQGATSSKVPGFTIYQTFKNLPMLFLKNVPTEMLFSVGVRFYFSYWLLIGNAIAHGNGWPAIKGVFIGWVLGFKKIVERQEIQRSKKVSTEYIKSIMWDDMPPEQTGLRKVRKIFTGIK